MSVRKSIINTRLLWFVEKCRPDKAKTSVTYEQSRDEIWQNLTAQLVTLVVSNLGTKHHLTYEEPDLRKSV